LRAVATAIREEGVLAYRLGGDEFVLEGEDPVSIQDAVDRIRERLGAAAIEAARPDGSARRLTGARIHAGLGGSLDEADAALNSAKRAAVGGRGGGGAVDLAEQVDEHAALLEDAPGALLGVAAYRIDDHVHAGDLLLEPLLLVVDDHVHADPLEMPEARAARGGDDVRPLPLRELGREGAHAAARAVDEEGLLRRSLRGVDH